MKKLAFVVAAVTLFAFAPIAERFGPVASSVALVWLGVLVAMLASGSASSLAVASGAMGAFGGGVLASVSPGAAGALFVAAAFAERTTRVRSRTARAVHVLLALVGGGFAGALSNAYTAAPLSVFVVAVVVAGVLAALPLLVDADDPVAHALEEAAQLVDEPAKRSLMDGAELRRNAAEVPLDRATAAKVKTTWSSLLRLAEARLRLERTRPRDGRSAHCRARLRPRAYIQRGRHGQRRPRWARRQRAQERRVDGRVARRGQPSARRGRGRGSCRRAPAEQRSVTATVQSTCTGACTCVVRSCRWCTADRNSA